ncbi:uncharacterized protein LOC113237799 [Hyposmocoma kahamanoa]|uniref:uncharacterized protein LOC113237799 n=1 Tax=Hyposmocoma kahamanoa TaxID=1477025 RepID=UPI000E6D76F3|nr:uncharacterized protein LOC113237799 [Hyposmocoma kahamanoa]
MGFLTLILCVIPTMVTAITISSNGNSPEVKMLGGMMVDVHKGFVPMALKQETTTNVVTTNKSNYDKSKTLANSTKLSINERYRRLIPYMTFYYANDIPTTEAYSSKSIEVEKVELVEAKTIQSNHRQPHKIVYAPQRNIPRYQGNRLTHFNIASANPTKVYYKNDVPVYQTAVKITPSYNPLVRESLPNHDHLRFVQKQVLNAPSAPFATRKPYLNLYSNDDGNFQYYLGEKNHVPKFKLVPYEQTPVKIVPQAEVYEPTKPLTVPVLIPKEPVFIKTKPVRPQYVYDNINVQQTVPRKQPVVVSENYYEKRRPASAFVQPIAQPMVESGFKPIVSPVMSTESTIYTTLPTTIPQFVSEKPNVQIGEPIAPERNFRPNYYQYVVEQPVYKTEQYVEPVPAKATVSLGDLLNSLQLNKSIPKPITQENVGSSIRTLLQVLNALKAMNSQNDVESPLLSTPKPFIAPEEIEEMSPKPIIEGTPTPVSLSPIPYGDLQNEPHLAQVNTPSQHLDESFPSGGGSTSQRFPLPVTSDDEGGTPGRPGMDYPVLTSIPSTSFDCKTQRYKGFFADPETRCQVWHYCDLNGGQASFLCPNGTIFSQAGLTCDWWFNVRCASTTQLYVLNESLYKYILPHSPKFPEDYSGPLVDKYLTLKFKEMEEQFKKNKNKQKAADKSDSDEKDESNEDSNEKQSDATEKQVDSENSEVATVSEASVIVQSPGTSGNVERLQDE